MEPPKQKINERDDNGEKYKIYAHIYAYITHPS